MSALMQTILLPSERMKMLPGLPCLTQHALSVRLKAFTLPSPGQDIETKEERMASKSNITAEVNFHACHCSITFPYGRDK